MEIGDLAATDDLDLLQARDRSAAKQRFELRWITKAACDFTVFGRRDEGRSWCALPMGMMLHLLKRRYDRRVSEGRPTRFPLNVAERLPDATVLERLTFKIHVFAFLLLTFVNLIFDGLHSYSGV